VAGKLLEKTGVDYVALAPRKKDESYENLLDMLHNKREALSKELGEESDDAQPEMMQEDGVSEATESLMDQAPAEEEVSAPSSGLMGRPE